MTYEVTKTWPEKVSSAVHDGTASRNAQDSVNSRVESPAVSIKSAKVRK